MVVKLLETSVVQVRDLTPSVFEATIRFKPGEQLDFKAGHYVMVKVPKEGKRINKPYSIASTSTDQAQLQFCVKRVQGGFTSNWMYTWKPRDKIQVLGPMGFFLLREDSPKTKMFIAAGSGIAPIHGMIQRLFDINWKGEIWLFFGCRNMEEVIYHDLFEQWQKEHKNFHYVLTLSRPEPGWKGLSGYVQEYVKKMVTDPSNKEAYICGLIRMVDECKRTLEAIGFAKEDILHEKFT